MAPLTPAVNDGLKVGDQEVAVRYEGMFAEVVTITGHGGDEIGAYLARPLAAAGELAAT